MSEIARGFDKITTVAVFLRAPTLPISHRNTNVLLRAIGFLLHLFRTIAGGYTGILSADGHTGHSHTSCLAVYGLERVGFVCTSAVLITEPAAATHIVSGEVRVYPGHRL